MAVPERRSISAEDFLNMFDETNERYELFDGVIKAQAAPNHIHQKIIGELFYEFKRFIKGNNGKCEPIISPFDVKLDKDNVVQPDFMVVCDKSKLDEKRCYGAPDLTVEVVSADRTVDYTRKLALYRRFGVREYWIVDPSVEKTVVYIFGDEKRVDFRVYDFEENIPVGIFDGGLTVNVSEMLS